MEVQVLSPAPPARPPTPAQTTRRSAVPRRRLRTVPATDGESTVKTKVNPTGENEVELSVEVPAETVKKAYDRAVAKIREEMQLPGFRKGRVPVDLVIQNVGADFIRGEALEDAIPEWGDEALKEAGLYDDAVGTSDLQVGPLDETQDYAFTLKVQTMPVPDARRVQGPRGAQARRSRSPTTQVDGAAGDAAGAARQPAAGRGPRRADRATSCSWTSRAAVTASPSRAPRARTRCTRSAAATSSPASRRSSSGVKAGEEKIFDVTFPDDYHAEELAGQAGHLHGRRSRRSRRRSSPSWTTPSPPTSASSRPWTSCATTCASACRRPPRPAREREFRAAAVEKAVEHATLDVPSTMVDREAHRLYHELEERVGEQGLTMEVYLGVLEKTEEDIEEEMRPQAEFIIKRQLVLEAIAAGGGPRGHRRRHRRGRQARRRGARPRPPAAPRRSARSRAGVRRCATKC